eukprot:scaffold3787_cov258-Pinguiococcus_pyrenoidosus.AAC.9
MEGREQAPEAANADLEEVHEHIGVERQVPLHPLHAAVEVFVHVHEPQGVQTVHDGQAQAPVARPVAR